MSEDETKCVLVECDREAVKDFVCEFHSTDLDTWGHCTRCGCDDISGDICAPLCPRCQQLADMEREIGRAVIEAGVIFHSTNPAIDELIAQWRKLHAEGAKGEQ